jgi:hypothetical protein
VIETGEAVPGARVWRSSRESLSLRDVAAEGPFLLLFYLFDWSST